MFLRNITYWTGFELLPLLWPLLKKTTTYVSLTLHTKNYGLESLINGPQMTFSKLRATFRTQVYSKSQIYDETREQWGVTEEVTSIFCSKFNVSLPQKSASSTL